MSGWNKRETIRRCAFIFCAIVMLMPILAMAVSGPNSALNSSADPKPMILRSMAMAAQERASAIAPSTVKPWLKPTGTPGFVSTEAESTTLGTAPDLPLISGETDIPAEDTELSQSQLDTLLQNAELAEDETGEDYLSLPEGIRGEDDALSILLIGVDNRDMEKPGRSDTMILMKLNVKTGTVKMVSFLRDMYVKIPGKGMNRLNAAYYYGGAPLLAQTLETNFGVRIDGTVAINFSVMSNIVDQLGGITLSVNEKERKQINQMIRDFSPQAEPLEQAGEQHLNGPQALCYSRIRKIDSDFQRTSRQHKVIEAMLARIRESDTSTLLTLMSGNWDSVRTDLALSDVSGLLPLMLNMSEISFTSMHVPLDNAFHDDVISGMMVLVPNLAKNSKAIATFLGQ